jgi:uncharacterized membrane protein YdjX (TVP38/TMEM64 family)
VVAHRLRRIRLQTWIKAAFGLFLLAAFLFFFPIHRMANLASFSHIIGWVGSARANGWTLLIFFLAFSLAILGLPVTVFPIVAGVLFPFWVAFPASVMAEMTGASLAFGIARFFGREAVETFLRGRLKLFDRFTAHEGIKAVLFVRISGVPPFVMANYLLGLSGVTVREYLLGTLIGVAPWTALMTMLSGGFWQAAVQGGEKGLMKAVVAKMAPLSAISLLAISGFVVSGYVRRKKTQLRRDAHASHSNL